MQLRPLGSTDLMVSGLGLGTMTWGARTSYDDAAQMLRTFVDAGGNLIDSAAAYGRGEVESLIGRMLARTVRRSSLVIATKAGFVQRDGARLIDNSVASLISDLEGSLRRLGTDWIDLWQIHAWDEAHFADTLEAAEIALTRGLVRQVGVSNYVGWQVAEMAGWQQASGHRPIACAQAEYSLLARRAELELLPCLRHLQMGFIAWSSLGRGVLTGKYQRARPSGSRAADPAMSWFVEPYLDDPANRLVAATAYAAQGLGLTTAQVAHLWARDAPGVTACLVGPRDVSQLVPLLETDQIALPPEITAALDDISGGPDAGRD
ncbi:MAG: aldo/keto reductase [Propionibacteriaceae bacterium]|jgi:aryl-alcohol dehydrogenase-like predicted oxidoreductase|nr:aldo/keto reductase [Propionibacteriaceae bacterium]